MRRITIYRGLVVAVLLMVASVARAEIVGIKDVTECPTVNGSIVAVKDKSLLISAMNNLSPQSVDAAPYFQADKNRFVFCMDTNPKLKDATAILQQTTLVNNTAYPVIIYDLVVNSSSATIGQPLLTTTGPILLQNLTATNLRGPIVLNGAASMRDSTLSCDTTSGNVYTQGAILEVNGFGEKVSTTTVTNCKSGIHVAGMGNILSDVVITADAAMTVSIATGVTLGGSNILTSSAAGKSVIGGTVQVEGGKVTISKSTLGGDPAVQIAKGLTGVTVTQKLC